ncbi:MAG: BrnA antitoxin family protein [Oceanicaulis sp.]|uniref:BrnA antitoxin family protein n=1 Tax=Glycocaulis sp. TaxID=1969725 RepID=UPI0025BBAA6F|nr:BrnA antitoxin family protein [Glycocaulis sp.]MCC5981802.1 BrnA antitoxin family protein [Oceanicaulis sp.]MCH8522822.1 BrnA antitoxin family protein [Glycocaulis sp.]
MGRIVRVKLEDLPPISEERLREIEAIPDEEIDFSDIPELTEEDFARGVWHTGHGKQQVTVRLDRDVLAFFKKGGRGYQTRINAVLRAFMEAQRKTSAE